MELAANALTTLLQVQTHLSAFDPVEAAELNWLINVAITAAGKGSRIEISPRYVPSKQMDLNSKSTLVADYTIALEKSLQEKLKPAER